MIDQADITKALGQVIVASGQFPRVVWANRDAAPDKPYLVLNLRPVGISDPTIAQTSPKWSGALQGTIVTGLNEFDTAAQAQCKALAELFPSGTRYMLTGGQKIVIAGHPSAGVGYRDGADYRMPVTIQLRSE